MSLWRDPPPPFPPLRLLDLLIAGLQLPKPPLISEIGVVYPTINTPPSTVSPPTITVRSSFLGSPLH